MNIQITSNGVSLDLLSNESIKIVDSIQDTKDISKISSAYSQQFNLPATDKNNKFFKHYYNYDVLDGFDARYKIDCEISISGGLFKKGKLRLNSVQIEDGHPKTYKVVFFSDSIDLKDLIADDLLSSLPVSQFNHPYTAQKVRDGLRIGLSEDGVVDYVNRKIIYPLISTSRRFTYDNTDGFREFNNSGLDSYLKKEDLKPAINVKSILEAIEEKYNITFSSNFFNTTTIKNLFLWLHRNKGGLLIDENDNEVGTVSTDLSEWTFNGTGDDVLNDASIEPNYFDFVQYAFSWYIYYSGTAPYTAKIIDNATGQVLAEQTYSTGGNHLLAYQVPYQIDLLTDNVDYSFIIEAQDLLLFTQELRVFKYFYINSNISNIYNGYYDTPYNDVTNQIRINRLMPKMKVADFLTALFKMFNLTAYKLEDTLYIEPLQRFYEDGKYYDITQYVDATKNEVERLFAFKGIDFSFKGKDTFLIKKRNEVTGLNYGDLNYTGDVNFDGELYTIEVDAEKMLFERISNEDTGNLTGITYGWFVDEKQDDFVGKPLFFFRRQNNISETIRFNNDVGGSYFVSTFYQSASNIQNAYQTLNFGTEIDEATLTSNENSLFKRFYYDYVTSIYNSRARGLKVKARLPLNIILNYKLNDRFIINNKIYKINKIETDLITGESTLNLYNEILTPRQLSRNANPNSTKSQKQVNSLSFNPLASSIDSFKVDLSPVGITPLEINVFLDDELISTIPYISSVGFSGLEPDTNYRAGIQYILDVSGEDRTDIFNIDCYTLPYETAALSGTADDGIGDASSVSDTADLEP